MSVITSPTFDPKTYAQGLANDYVGPTKASLDKQTAQATAVSTALTTLNSALGAFQTALQGLASSTTSVTATKATFSNSAIATATAKSSATAGTYAFYVEQLATAGQVTYNVADSAAAGAGSMNVMLADGSSFQVDLASADSDKDGVLSAKEVAASINAAANNNSRVTASTMTINGSTQLVLSSNNTGASNAVASIDTSGLGSASLATALGNQTTLTTAKDAVIWAGGKNGTRIQQASNTFSVVDGVSFTITQAQSATDPAVTLTVGADTSGTASNVQKFVDAYNTLMGVIQTLTAAGDHSLAPSTDPTATPAPTSQDAALHGDAGLASLKDRLNALLRGVSGGQSLISYGISATKDGTLTIDSGRLTKALAANPDGLDNLFGRAGIGVDSGVLGAMNKLTNAWTTSAGGFIMQRTTQNDQLQSDLSDRMAALQSRFQSAYNRYLAQFTALQTLQASMTNTSNMFTAMFSPDSSS
ncbi:flagellar hook-associated protein 2 [Duganella sp. 1224]|uniref:flagellar filament capping protein FliD n=1 Tax=Duganella sp. 1224 TaxID=2587052 RepID=UPI0015C9D8B2|nr:flagellar filament capping protein FliD [Duganella sp. 1224]NYE59745.1 flagellar hook-associated protein 2 [Duganella sp. 1224]